MEGFVDLLIDQGDQFLQKSARQTQEFTDVHHPGGYEMLSAATIAQGIHQIIGQVDHGAVHRGRIFQRVVMPADSLLQA